MKKPFKFSGNSTWLISLPAFMFSIALSSASSLFAQQPTPTTLPTGGTIAAGSAGITTNGTRMDVNQSSDRAVINWNTFSIGTDAHVNFNQPTTSSVTLNRVLSGEASSIFGHLTANGKVFLINPNGIIFGANARVDVGSLVASTMGLSNNDFMAGRYRLSRNNSTASIVNHGELRASDGGFIALLAPEIINEGIISARFGSVAMAAGETATLSFNGNGLLSVALDPATVKTLLVNRNLILADSGQVYMGTDAANSMLSAVIKNDGVIQAHSLVERNGSIILDAGEHGTTQVTGSLDVSGVNGGTISLLGNRIDMQPGAQANATGTTGGGTVLIGGNWQGNGSERHASEVSVAQDTIIDASAMGNGNGGKVVLWSDNATSFAGTIRARGGSQSGNGGLIETSSHGHLGVSGSVDAGAPNGKGGTWLLDPKDVTIATGGSDTNDVSTTNPAASYTIDPTTIQAALTGTSVDIQANNDITVTDAISAPGVTYTLSLLAGRSVTLNNAITSDGDVIIKANHPFAGNVNRDAGAGGIMFGGAGSITTTGNVLLTVENFSTPGAMALGSISAATVQAFSGGDLTLNPLAQITTTAGGSALTLMTGNGNAFINNSDASALNPTNGGRFLIYSSDFATDTLNGISAAPIYNKSYGTYAPGSVTQSGNRILYSAVAPTLTITADDKSRLYGDNNPALTYSVTGLVNGDLQASALSGAPTLSTAALTTTGVGGYTINTALNTLASDYNYSLATVNGTLTINQRPLTVTASNASRIYGDTNPAVAGFTAPTGTAGSGSGLVNGDTIASVTNTIAGSATLTANAGTTHAITPSAAAFSSGSSGNYTITYNDGTLTITPRPLAVTAGNASRIYGDTNPAVAGFSAPAGAAGSGSGLVNGDTISSVTNTIAGSATLTANAGTTHAITPSAAVFSSGNSGNYTITYNNGTLSITQRPVTVTATDSGRVYGDTNPVVAGFTAPAGAAGSGSGLVNGDTIASVTNTIAGSATVTANAGTTHTITPSAAVFSSGAIGNYTITYSNGTLTINQRPLTVTAADASRVYGDTNPAVAGFTAPAGAAGSGSGLVNGDTIASVTNSIAGSATLTADAGTTHAITPSAAVFSSGTLGNYAITYADGALSINQRPLTVTAANAGRVYGDNNPVVAGFTAPAGAAGSGSGLVNGDTIASVTNTIAGSATLTADAGTSHAISPSAAVFSSGNGSNYTITYNDGTLTITQRPLTVTAADAGRVYGDTNPIVTGFTAPAGAAGSGSGLVNGDTIASVTNTIAGSATLTANAGSTHAIAPSAAVFSNGNSGNYTITYNNGTLTINQRPLTVTAADAGRVYGDTNPTVSGFTAPTGAAGSGSGLVNGDTIASVTNTIAGSANLTANAGTTHAITPSTAAFSSGTIGNYAITYTDGTLTISQRPLTVTAADAGRVYGDNNPTVTGFTAPTGTNGSGNGLVNGDTITSVTNSIAGSATLTANAGTTHAITSSAPVFSTGTLGNYAITYIDGTLTINQRPLNVTAANANRVYGDPNPIVSGFAVPAGTAGSGSGLVNGDTIASVTNTIAGSATLTANAGTTHAITPSASVFSSGTSGNYSITYNNGTLTITKAPLTITADNKTKEYGDSNPTLTASYSGLKNSETPTVVSGLNLDTPVILTTSAGTYPITPSGASALNYLISYVPGTFTVAASNKPDPGTYQDSTVKYLPSDALTSGTSPTTIQTAKLTQTGTPLVSLNGIMPQLSLNATVRPGEILVFPLRKDALSQLPPVELKSAQASLEDGTPLPEWLTFDGPSLSLISAKVPDKLPVTVVVSFKGKTKGASAVAITIGQ